MSTFHINKFFIDDYLVVLLEAFISLAFHWQMLPVSVSVSFCFLLPLSVHQPRLFHPNLTPLFFRCLRNGWRNETWQNVAGIDGWGSSLAREVMVFSGDCGRTEGTQQAGQVEPSRDNGWPREPNHRPSSDHLHTGGACVSAVIERFVRQQKQERSLIRASPCALAFLFPQTLGRRSVFDLRHNQTLSPLQTEESST